MVVMAMGCCWSLLLSGQERGGGALLHWHHGKEEEWVVET